MSCRCASSFSKFVPLVHACTYSCTRHDPLYASFLLLGILGTFKPYPTLSDPGLFLSFISLFPETYPRACSHLLVSLVLTFAFVSPDLRYPVVTALLHLHAFLLLPLFHHLWIGTGTGNANFFYASTLVFGLANGCALLDCVWAGLRVAIGEEKEGWVVTQE